MDGSINSKIRDNFWLKFTGWCHQAVIEAYRKMIKNSIDYKQWEEEDISAALYKEMEELLFIKSKQISIVPEFRLYNDKVKTGEKKAKNTDRIDFRFTKWKLKDEKKYFGEAKNLSHKTWSKLAGATVDASYYRGRYIETGIEKIVFGEYSAVIGFLIGYVVNGSAKNNVLRLNSLIQTRNLPPKIGLIENKMAICGYSECYISKNLKANFIINLQHIFLEFDNK